MKSISYQEYLKTEESNGRYTGAKLVRKATQALRKARPEVTEADAAEAVAQVMDNFEHFDGEPTSPEYVAKHAERCLDSGRYR